MSAPTDGTALIEALRDAAKTPRGRRSIAELVNEIRRAIEGADGDLEPAAKYAAELFGRRSRRRKGGAR